MSDFAEITLRDSDVVVILTAIKIARSHAFSVGEHQDLKKTDMLIGRLIDADMQREGEGDITITTSPGEFITIVTALKDMIFAIPHSGDYDENREKYEDLKQSSIDLVDRIVN